MLAISFLIVFIMYKKKSGYLYIDDEVIVFESKKSTSKIEFKSIKRIENAIHIRRKSPRSFGKPLPIWEFSVYLKDEKKPLDYFITNEIMVSVANEHNIPFKSRQAEFWKEYLLKKTQ